MNSGKLDTYGISLKVLTKVGDSPWQWTNPIALWYSYLCGVMSKVCRLKFLFVFCVVFLNSCGYSTAKEDSTAGDYFFAHLQVQSMGPNHP